MVLSTMGDTLSILGEVFVSTIGLWWIILPTIFVGLIVGGIPGFSAANTIIILMPLTLAMDLRPGWSSWSRSIAPRAWARAFRRSSSTFPGTAGAAATPLDGYPMAKAGKGQQALAMSFVASSLGGLLTTIIALATMPLLARVGFYMHSVEMIVVMLFGISLIAIHRRAGHAQGADRRVFGPDDGGSIGTDVIYATPRGTFGFLELYDGVPLIPALVGLFAVSEAFVIIEKRVILSRGRRAAMKNPNWHDTFEGVRMAFPAGRTWSGRSDRAGRSGSSPGPARRSPASSPTSSRAPFENAGALRHRPSRGADRP